MKILLFLISITVSEVIHKKEFRSIVNCFACQMIWENIVEGLGDRNRSNIKLAADAFQSQCKMQPQLFYSACDQMFENLYDLSLMYCQKKSITEICNKAKICNLNQTKERKLDTQLLQDQNKIYPQQLKIIEQITQKPNTEIKKNSISQPLPFFDMTQLQKMEKFKGLKENEFVIEKDEDQGPQYWMNVQKFQRNLN